jgi:hypothetical protein
VRCPVEELPRSAKIEVPLENPDRAREIPATEVGETESEQSVAQRVGMIGLLSDPHRGFGMFDGIIELAELGEHNGEPGP